MFQHAATEGQKKEEQIVHQGHQQTLSQLNPEVGIPAIQLVGLEMSKEELLELYLEVYKLHRLPGSPPGEPAILKEVLSSLPDHQRCEEERHLQPQQGPILKAPIPLGAVPPTKERKMTWWKEAWPWYARPIKKCWPWWLPLRRRVWRPFPFQTYQRDPVHQSQLWRRDPESFWDGRKYYTHPNKWWLPGRSPNHPRP